MTEESQTIHSTLQPRSQDLFPGLGVGRDPPPSQGKGPGNEVEYTVDTHRKFNFIVKMQFLLPECAASRCLIFKTRMSLSISLFSLLLS